MRDFLRGILLTTIAVCLLSCVKVYALDIGQQFTRGDLCYEVINDNHYYEGKSAIVTGSTFSKDLYIDIIVPESVKYDDETLSVCGVKAFAFYENAIKSIKLSEGNRIIEKGAFANCKMLISADLPKTIEVIEDCAFYGCSALSKLDVYGNIKSFGTAVFTYCSSLDSVNLVTDGPGLHYGDNIFYSGDYSTVYCAPNARGDVSISAYTTKVAPYAFEGNNLIKSITFADSNKEIGECAFLNCASLKTVKFGGIEKICTDAFTGCSALTSVTLPKTLKEIEGNPFFCCSSLKTVKVDSDNESFSAKSNILYNKDKTVLIVSFSDTAVLTLPSSVVTIEEGAFMNNQKLKTVVIPKKIETIGAGAFYGCNKLETVIFKSRSFTIESPQKDGAKAAHSSFGAFDQTTYHLYIELPYSSKASSDGVNDMLKKNSPAGVMIGTR